MYIYIPVYVYTYTYIYISHYIPGTPNDPLFQIRISATQKFIASFTVSCHEGGDTGNDCIGTAVRQGAKSAAWRHHASKKESLEKLGKVSPKAWKKHPKATKKENLAVSQHTRIINKIVHITMGYFFRGHNFGIQDPSVEAAISNCKTIPPPTKKHRATELSSRKNLADQLQDKKPFFSKESSTDHSTDHTASEDFYMGPFGCMEACTWMIWTDISNWRAKHCKNLSLIIGKKAG